MVKFCLPFIYLLVFFSLVNIRHTQAGDRPFTQLSVVTNDGDDDRTFSSEASTTNSRDSRGAAASLEYSVDPTLSFQMEVGALRTLSTREVDKELDFEVRKAFTNPAREGYGVGLAASVEWSHATGGGSPRFGGASVVMPLSIPLQERTLWLHGNLGAQYIVGDKTRALWGVAVSKEFVIKTVTFLEYAGRVDDFRVVNAGVRFFGRRRRTSLDFSVGRHFPVNGQASNFIQIGFGFFDRSY
jgi:hypothetical protein